MSLLTQFQLFSQYNQLMNQRLYDAAGKLSREAYLKDQGAFFGSVSRTLNHIMVGDIIWLKRFAEHPSSQEALSYFSALAKPASLDVIIFDKLEELRHEREKMDNLIIQWMRCSTEQDLDGSLSYTNMTGRRFTKSFASLVSHLFLHQIHHRGQATTLLSQSGIDFGDTDIIEIIDELR